MSQELFRLASRYAQAYGWTKTAGRKKIEYKSSNKELNKLKAERTKVQREFKIIDSEYQKISSHREKLKSALKRLNQEISGLVKKIDEMETAGAEAIYKYDDGDCSFVIDGKEFHREEDEFGEVNYSSMRDYRKKKKRALSEEEKQELQAEGLSEEEIAELDVPEASQDSSNAEDSVTEPDLNDESLLQFLEQF